MFKIVKNAIVGLGLALKRWTFQVISQWCDSLINLLLRVKARINVDGMVFDGDEVAQNRMTRAVVASEPLDTTTWTLNNNTAVIVTREQLKAALLLAGQAQTAIWEI